MRWPTLSFRVRILLVGLAGIIPLAVAGMWLAGTAARSGEALLRDRLGSALDDAVAELGPHWVRLRSELLNLADGGAVRAAAGAAPGRFAAAGPAAPPPRLPAGVDRVEFLAADGTRLWSLASQPLDPGGPILAVALDVFDVAGERIGHLASDVRLLDLMPQRGGRAAQAGVTLAIHESGTGAWLLPLPWEAAGPEQRRVDWGGEQWVVERRRVADPPLDLVAAAPLDPFSEPFRDAARRGAWIVLAVLLTGLAIAMGLAGQLTRSLERLAAAADAVGRGALDTRVEEAGADEIGRVARAFNTMTAGLRRALAELSRREALAAVGQFAASLAHEVRNPLTSIKVDLQLVEESLPADSSVRELQRGALDEIDRLDRTVAGVLRIARSGVLETREVELEAVLAGALHAAEPALRQRAAGYGLDVDERIVLPGDPDALRQLFLNLMLNAAQALDDDGGSVIIEARSEAEHAVVRVRDTGVGMAPDVAARAFEPFFSARAGGSGLGLALAQRIAEAHHGSIAIDSQAGAGTTVTVRLPLGRV